MDKTESIFLILLSMLIILLGTIVNSELKQDRREYIAERRNNCYDIYEKEYSKWENVRSAEYDKEKDVCIIKYIDYENNKFTREF